MPERRADPEAVRCLEPRVMDLDPPHALLAQHNRRGRGGFRQNSLAVYRVTGDDVTKEFFEENSARSVTALKWLGNDTLSFVESTTDPPRETQRVLKRESGSTWKVR